MNQNGHNGSGQVELENAPPAEQRSEDYVAPKPALVVRLMARIAGETGIEFEAEVANLAFKGTQDLATQLKTFESQLKKAGFKPVERAPAVVAAPAAAAPDAPSSDGPQWIKGVNGGPPRCSLHGPAKWVEGDQKPTNKDGTPNPKAGQHFAFWGCSVNGCRPKGSPQ